MFHETPFFRPCPEGHGKSTAGSTGTKMVTVEPSTGQLHYRDVLSVSAIGASPNANGMTLTETTLNLQPAND